MSDVINLYKSLSLTPLQTLEKLRIAKPELKHATLAYAGRLDPMAEGVLLVLVGEECKKRKSYELLTKEYEFEVLFGISTDTYDVMGKITEFKISNLKFKIDLQNCINSFYGKKNQFYPPYSSARVNGKPLYYWARENKLHEIEIPKKEIEIYDLKYEGERYISAEELLNNISERVSKVDGKFRQTEILEQWNNILKKNSNFNFLLSTFSICCTSGTYVRSIANEIGQKLGVPSLAYSIKRTKIGDFRIEDSLKI